MSTATKVKPMRIEIVKNDFDEIQAATDKLWKAMSDGAYPFQKVLVMFKHPVEVRVNARKVSLLDQMKVRFFTSIEGNLCYTFYRRTGYRLTWEIMQAIESLTIFPWESEKEKQERLKKSAKSIIDRMHPNAWENLRNDEYEVIDLIENFGMTITNIEKKFPPHVMRELAEAFENKKNFSWKQYGARRDFSVETKLCDDGVFRAWYSSEFAGWANGDYWLLLNPTTAAFKDRD